MDGVIGLIFVLVYLAIIVLMVASMWKIFVKANEPGWAAFIPIYNFVILLKICGKPIWWIVLFLIPLVSFVAAILIYVSFAKSFGKSTGFALGIIFLPFIFLPMLAFSDATYQGPAG